MPRIHNKLRKYGITDEIYLQKTSSGLRWCGQHKDFVPLSLFSGTSRICNPCYNKMRRDKYNAMSETERKQFNHEHHIKNKEKIWRHMLKWSYNVTPEWYEEQLSKQEGHCKLCPRKPGKKRLHIEHNHKTGQLRGLVCSGCNLAISRIDEDPKWIDRLKEHVGLD